MSSWKTFIQTSDNKHKHQNTEIPYITTYCMNKNDITNLWTWLQFQKVFLLTDRIEIWLSPVAFISATRQYWLNLHDLSYLKIQHCNARFFKQAREYLRTVAGKSLIGGLYVCAGGLDIENLSKIPLIRVFYISFFGGFVLCLRG